MTCKGICKRYQVTKPISGGRYASGQSRCQLCEIFIKWAGKNCPCCGYRLRNKPRNLKYTFLLKGIKIDSTTKTKFVGSGKDPKLKLFINDEYLKSVPRLIISQFEALKEDIETNGQQEPIVVNQDGKILDGHTRYQILSMLEKSVNYIVRKFKTVLEERTYVVTANLKRRQLSQFQIFELSEHLRNMMIDKRKSEQSLKMWATRKGEKEPEALGGTEKYTQSTDYQFAKITGLGAGQIEACVYVKAHGNDELIEEVRQGKVTVNHAKTLLLERDNKYYQSHLDRKVDQAPNCDKCGAITRKRRGCHVHKEWCCTKCVWGI